MSKYKPTSPPWPQSFFLRKKMYFLTEFPSVLHVKFEMCFTLRTGSPLPQPPSAVTFILLASGT